MDVKRAESKRKYSEIVSALKEVLKKARFYKQKPGRPKKSGVTKELSVPSKVLKKYKYGPYKNRRKLLREIEEHPVLGKVVKEYKDLLYNKLVKVKMTPAELRYYANLTDLSEFRFRRPTLIEQAIIGDYVLPSRLFDYPLPAEADIELYKEISKEGRLDIREYEFPVKMKGTFEEYIETYRRIITEALINEMSKNKLKPGFYLRITAHTYFERPDGSIIEKWLGSLTSRRPEVFVGTKRDIRKVVELCLKEIFLRVIPKYLGPESNMRFLDIIYVVWL